MAKRINVSIPEEDKAFCEGRRLSPSKLLQERISQIRDENNPILIKNLNEERRHSENLSRKVNHFSTALSKVGEMISEKFGDKAFEDIFNNI